MIIKYSIPNPALDKSETTQTFVNINNLDTRGWCYYSNVDSFIVHDAIDGNDTIRTMMEVMDSKTHERTVFYLTGVAYVMNSDGKTIETIIPHERPVKRVQTKVQEIL